MASPTAPVIVSASELSDRAATEQRKVAIDLLVQVLFTKIDPAVRFTLAYLVSTGEMAGMSFKIKNRTPVGRILQDPDHLEWEGARYTMAGLAKVHGCKRHVDIAALMTCLDLDCGFSTIISKVEKMRLAALSLAAPKEDSEALEEDDEAEEEDEITDLFDHTKGDRPFPRGAVKSLMNDFRRGAMGPPPVRRRIEPIPAGPVPPVAAAALPNRGHWVPAPAPAPMQVLARPAAAPRQVVAAAPRQVVAPVVLPKGAGRQRYEEACQNFHRFLPTHTANSNLFAVLAQAMSDAYPQRNA